MPIVFNGVEVDNKSGDMVFNGVNLTEVRFNNTKVWEQRASPGTQLFTASGTFVVPVGYTEVTICMCGGGGSGRNGGGGGGYAGQIVSQTVAVVEGQIVPITIGAGGSPSAISNPGNPGGSSYFGPVVAVGGAGGGLTNYVGDGASRVSCGGTFYDGTELLFDDGSGYSYIVSGGQAGAFGNGGNGTSINFNSPPGNVGIGAGAGAFGNTGSLYGEAGGNGQCVVSWS